MRQIIGIGGEAGNRQSGPVRTYVLYFERLTSWTLYGQGDQAHLSERGGFEPSRNLKRGGCRKRSNDGQKARRRGMDFSTLMMFPFWRDKRDWMRLAYLHADHHLRPFAA